MQDWIISRHAAAATWIRREIGMPNVPIVDHLQSNQLAPGDRLYGTLPLHLIEQACRLGATCWMVVMDLSAEMRGRELTPAEMDAAGARLQQVTVTLGPVWQVSATETNTT